MKTLTVSGSSGTSLILVGERLENLGKYIDAKQTVIITDSDVFAHYGEAMPPVEIITIGTGEGIKTLETIAFVYKRLVALEADRSTFIVGIGGGIVCDITGFVASTYLRGVKFGFVSTTLLSQVDASVGGKNGVNFDGFKNMVGVFNQPEFVICDMNLLTTLDHRDRLCGFGEIVKHALIADAGMFSYLEDNIQAALALDPVVIEKLVWDSVAIKSGVVNRDEKERGERRKLNFGHTFGHAIEKKSGIPHGEAVSIGMVAAARLSVQKGILSAAVVDRIENLLQGLGLPTRSSINPKELFIAMKKDKKREGVSIHFVFLKDLGSCMVEEIRLDALEKLMEDTF